MNGRKGLGRQLFALRRTRWKRDGDQERQDWACQTCIIDRDRDGKENKPSHSPAMIQEIKTNLLMTRSRSRIVFVLVAGKLADQGRAESPGEPRVCFINGGSDIDQRTPFRDSNNFLLLTVAP
jgi:hypothetical protein